MNAVRFEYFLLESGSGSLLTRFHNVAVDDFSLHQLFSGHQTVENFQWQEIPDC